MSHKLVSSCALLALGLTTGAIFADQDQDQDTEKKGKIDVPEQPQRPKSDVKRPHNRQNNRPHDRSVKGGSRLKSFEAADVNNDGVITFEEFSKIGRLANLEEEKKRKLYDFLDRNKDDKLEMKELQPREPVWVGTLRNSFIKLDTDRSGGLDLAEFSKLPYFAGKDAGGIARFFAKMDRNKNKLIDRGELKWIHSPGVRPHFDFAQFDANESGGLDFEEYSKLPLMSKCPEDRRKHLFERIDANKDGEISSREIKAAHQLHRPPPPRGIPSKPRRGKKRDGEESSPRRDHDRPGNGGKTVPPVSRFFL